MNMLKEINFVKAITILLLLNSFCIAFPEQGKWSFTIKNQSQDLIGIAKSLAKDSTISIKVTCDPADSTHVTETPKIKIGWVVRQTQCWKEYMEPDLMVKRTLQFFYICPEMSPESFFFHIHYLKTEEVEVTCDHTIDLSEIKEAFISKMAVPFENTSCSFQDDMGIDTSALRNVLSDSKKESVNQEDSQQMPEVGKSKRSAADEVKDYQNQESQPKVEKSTKPQNTKDSGNTAKTTVKQEDKTKNENSYKTEAPILPSKRSHDHQVLVDQEGVYLLVIMLRSQNSKFNATVDIEMKGPHGYLSAADWPLLPFFGTMCGLYVFYAVVWLIVSALQWRDLLRIQFWIGGVIFLGMLEKAVFYAEYQSVNSTGLSVRGAILFAEVLSCLKKTMASMLIIIVSLGFGIVKPRLGPMLHRVVGVGLLYFLLGTVEACLRVLKPQNHTGKQALMGLLPLAVLESGMCWWVFSSLVQTTRTLRLRRNVVKLTLYRHFTNALIFAVIASVVFMIWSFHSHNVAFCLADWKELWVDIAYWHLLFGVLLLVIMVLWRPTNNNQRYAFTPLLDAADDEEEDPVFSNDAFDGMKMRSAENQGKPSPKEKERKQSNEEDDLRWVEENIPSSLAETALPSLMDSEEEILATKFERNKME